MSEVRAIAHPFALGTAVWYLDNGSVRVRTGLVTASREVCAGEAYAFWSYDVALDESGAALSRTVKALESEVFAKPNDAANCIKALNDGKYTIQNSIDEVNAAITCANCGEPATATCSGCNEQVCAACVHENSAKLDRIICTTCHCDICDDSGTVYRSRFGGSDPNGEETPCGHNEGYREPEIDPDRLRDHWDY